MRDNNTLLRKIGAGDRAAFNQLYTSNQKEMTGYAAAILGGDAGAGEDAFNEAFADIWKLVGRFNPVGNATAWIRRIVRNKAIDILRKPCRKEISSADSSLCRVPDDARDPEQEALLGDQRRWLRTILSTLSENQREVVFLCYFEGLGLQDIAEQTGVPTGTVKSRLFHARKKLKSHLEKSA